MATKHTAKKEAQRTNRTSLEAFTKLKEMIDTDVSVAFDQFRGLYQATVYPNGKADLKHHVHYEAPSLEEAINVAHAFTIKKGL
jgi:hypothetical protein